MDSQMHMQIAELCRFIVFLFVNILCILFYCFLLIFSFMMNFMLAGSKTNKRCIFFVFEYAFYFIIFLIFSFIMNFMLPGSKTNKRCIFFKLS